MASHVNKQQRAILLISLLGIRRLQGSNKPERKHVLAFIRVKKLMAWDDEDLDWSDAGCLVGDNRISWKRMDLVMDGLIVSKPGTASWGIWELSVEGIRKTKEIVKKMKERFDEDPQAFEKFKKALYILKLTDEFFNLVLQLAHDDFSTRYYPINGKSSSGTNDL